tara:strand:- start:106 stop:537 length:432 start_codon:yes stop_codon:yes gene_type:complete
MANEDGSRLRLLANDEKDLAVISSMLQDAIVMVADMVFLQKEQSFVMAVNRFRWELPDGEIAGERVNAGLRFACVRGVQFRNINRQVQEGFAAVLSITYDSGLVLIRFSGDGALRLEVSKLICALHDFDLGWPTIWRPKHPVD